MVLIVWKHASGVDDEGSWKWKQPRIVMNTCIRGLSNTMIITP